MKKTLTLLLGIALAASAYSQVNYKAQIFYMKNILKPILSQPYRNIEYRIIEDADIPYNASNSFTKKVMKNKNEIAFLDDYFSQQYYLFSKEYFKFINNESLELMKGRCNGSLNYGEDKDGIAFGYSAHWRYNNYCMRHIDNFPQLIMQKKATYTEFMYILFNNMFDTTINNVSYTAISYDKKRHIYNDSTESFDIPNYITITYYYNNVEKRLQYIHSRPMDYPGNEAWEKKKIELNITFEDNRNIIDSIFNFDQEKYKKYSRHNNTDSLPLSWTYKNVKSEELNDTVLDYPIVSLADGNTTTLRSQNGWTMLYFWTLGCGPCFEEMNSLSNNTEKIGLEYMEKHNIKLMMINPIAGNTETLLPVVGRFNINHILYHSKGFGKIFGTYKYPTIVLISPDKKAFYRLKTIDEVSMYI
ncbi:MAG: hypothetical protein IJ269_04120 [Bacteroidales bacterium]|nr:hypothetical protein [Bacteroidales bacterium]